MILPKQFEAPSSLLIEVMNERNHVDESVCHVQEVTFQTSLGRERALPVCVGMGWLGTESGEAQSKFGPCGRRNIKLFPHASRSRSVTPAFDTDLWMTLIHSYTALFKLQLASFQQGSSG
jgi:hypothetical protein